MKNLERRYTTLDLAVIEPDESRADDEQPKIAGHAAVFNQLSEDLGGWREQIAPGAFSKSIGGDVRALFNHDPNIILGRTTAKTLRLSEDNIGLFAEITPPDTETAHHVIEALRRGDISHMSFGFQTITDKWEEQDGEAIRTLIEVKLFDVSPVTFAAYPQTDIALRSYQEFIKSIRDPWRLNLAERSQQLVE